MANKADITGIVFGDKSLEWTTVRQGKERLEAVASGEITLQAPPSVGEGLSADETASAEQQPENRNAQMRKELSALGRELIVGIPSRHLLLRAVNLPIVGDEELASMVQLQVDKFSPFPLETLVISHEILQKGAENCLVLIAAVKGEIVEKIGKIFSAGGIVPRRVDAAVLGWWKLAKDAGQNNDKGRDIALLMTEDAAEIVVLQDGFPILFRSLGNITDVAEDEFIEETITAIQHTLMSLELEHGATGKCGISVWHRGPAPDRLIGRLRNDCRLEVKARSIDTLPTTAEGLARRSLEQAGQLLDLTPLAWRDLQHAGLFKRRMIWSAAGVIGTWLLFLLVIFGGIYVQELLLAGLKKEKNRLDKPAKEVVNMQNRVIMIRRYMDRSKSSLECLREISADQPEGVDLTSFTYRKGEGVKISGEAEAANIVYDFKNTLDESHFFTGSSLDGPRRDPRRGKEIFDIEMKLPAGREQP